MDERDASRQHASTDFRSWAIWRLSVAVQSYAIVVEILAVAAVASSVYGARWNDVDAERFGLLLCLGVGFQAVSRRTERLRHRLSEGPFIDMSSVWTTAAVIALPGHLAVLLTTVVAAAARAPLQMPLFRKLLNIAFVILTVTITAQIFDAVSAGRSHGEYFLSVLLAVVCVSVINVSLVAIVVYLSNRRTPLSIALGDRESNLLELSTSSIGVLAGVAIMDSPWLVLAVLLPMTYLQRGAFFKQLEVAATTDDKTGLLNAGTWRRLGHAEIVRSARENYTSSVFVIDMDHFKSINDTRGHLAGDRVLIAVAECLRAEMREYDILGRFGGEEFVVLLVDVDLQTARTVSHRILQGIRELEVSTEDDLPPIRGLSVSLGAAMYPVDGDQIENLVRRADEQMYRAKRDGRDRVQFCEADLDVEAILGGAVGL